MGPDDGVNAAKGYCDVVPKQGSNSPDGFLRRHCDGIEAAARRIFRVDGDGLRRRDTASACGGEFLRKAWDQVQGIGGREIQVPGRVGIRHRSDARSSHLD
jgi:hypothetical protein